MSQDLPPPESINPEDQPDFLEIEASEGEEETTPSKVAAESEWLEELEPQSLPRREPTRSMGDPQSRTLRSAQGFWDTWQPRLRRQAVTILRSTGQTLERLANRLESDSSLAETTQESGATVRRAPSETGSDWLATLQEIAQSAWNWWRGILPKIRDRLPESINRVLSSDQALTGAIAGVLLLLLWIVNGIVSPAPKPVTVAVRPAPVATPTPTPVANPPVIETQPITIEPTPAPALDQPRETSTPTASPEVKPLPPPTPPLKLTPEQKLIARIQDQVAEISDQYVSGLIQSVQANFRASRLVVKISPDWYGLTHSQQDNLANEIYLKTRDLDFADLEIQDPDNYRLARSPVVGSNMVILKRTREPVESLPEAT